MDVPAPTPVVPISDERSLVDCLIEEFAEFDRPIASMTLADHLVRETPFSRKSQYRCSVSTTPLRRSIQSVRV
jgi:hypothetical protein